MRVCVIYFVMPQDFNKPDAFRQTTDTDWWPERQGLSLYIGKTVTTNITRFRSIYSPYHNNEADSTNYKSVYLNRNLVAAESAWHYISFISDGTSLIIIIDDLAPITAEAFPSTVLDFKAFARVSLVSHYNASDFPFFMPRGPMRMFDYELTREQHQYIYHNEAF